MKAPPQHLVSVAWRLALAARRAASIASSFSLAYLGQGQGQGQGQG